ncbi:MAG TPA: PHP domain-containing protein [Candidatus Ozemobacteraceae bacterium]|nr:PHP domain-containing protein [Candidatus Ozemobacteraceae bacterium]
MTVAVVADLHTHSNASDGVLAPAELVQKAAGAGLRALALTDHDTLNGIPEALTAGAQSGLQIIPGIELSCGWADREPSLHMLGLFIDHRATGLNELLDQQRRGRKTRALQILDKLEGLGVPVQPLRESFLREQAQALGRPHIARYLVDIKAIQDFQEGFRRYLGRGCPAYVPKPHVLPEDGIRLVHQAGGIACIAHPGLVPDWDAIWPRIAGLPWDGIEAVYAEHTPSQVERFTALARSQNWLITGGSDYHGEAGKHVARLGEQGLTDEQFQQLAEAARQRLSRRGELT